MPVVYNWVECPAEDLAVGDMIRMSSESESRSGPIERLVLPGAGSIVGSVYVDGVRYVFRRGESVERWEQVPIVAEKVEIPERGPVPQLLVRAKALRVGDVVVRVEMVDVGIRPFVVKDLWVEYITKGDYTVGVAFVWDSNQFLFDGPPVGEPYRWSPDLILVVERL